MNFTFHLTNNCNLACKYCFHEKKPIRMQFDVAKAAIDLSLKNGESTGISFFGGEPLLERKLIEEIIAYTEQIHKDTGHAFYYKMTTNGTLLDEEFIQLSKKIHMVIGLSHDGIMQDDCRVYPNGAGTATMLEQKIALLLKYQPYSIAMVTISPDTVSKFAESVNWLFQKGFRYFVTTPAYGSCVQWDDVTLKELKRQYKVLTNLYYEWTIAGEKFYFGTFDSKIESYINNDKHCKHVCHMGRNQFAISPNGNIYPCNQFVGDALYYLGNVATGIETVLQQKLADEQLTIPESCQECVIRNRCIHTCGCMNKIGTGFINQVSPFQCEHERMLIPIVDELAEKLYKKKNQKFIQKHYNEWYPIISLIESYSKSQNIK